jgi:outer membrane protein TolC
MLVLAALPTMAAGCQSAFERIDRRVDDLIAETSVEGSKGPRPTFHPPGPLPEELAGMDPAATELPTDNPPASSFDYEPLQEAETVNERLDAYTREPEDATRMGLREALAYAMGHSRAYLFAEEDYLLAALQVLIERHLFSPRLFNDTTVLARGTGDDGRFDTALDLINEFRVSQRLPYGGELMASVLVSATEDLHERVAGELRGAGTVASENLIQAERDLVYAARDFERFRREFLFEIASEFLDLVVQQQGIRNSVDQVASLEALQERDRALYEAGRITRYDLGLAEQRTVDARDSLNVRQESYRLALDRFKVRLGMPTETSLIIVPPELKLVPPQVTLEEAVVAALLYRLDLQNARDRLEDSLRNVANARNAVLPDLNVFGLVQIPTDDDRDRAGLDFEPGDTSFSAGIELGLPLDRQIERIGVRQAQIDFERSRRGYTQFRDEIAVEARASVRDIDRSLFSLQIQEQGILIAEERKASIEAAPERVDARDSSDAVDALNEARNARDEALRDLQVSILEYLLNTGQMRVRNDGYLDPLPGMEVVDPAGDPQPVPVPPGAGQPAAPGGQPSQPPAAVSTR